MKIRFSDFERSVICDMHKAVPWQGTPDAMAARYALGEALQLDAFLKANSKKPVDKLSREPSFTVDLAPPMLNLLTHIVAGGGGNVSGEHAPVAAKLVVRLLAFAPKPPAPPAPAPVVTKGKRR